MHIIKFAAAIATSVACACGMASAAPMDALAIYTFDNADATDSSGNDNNGTVVGAGGTTFTAAGGGQDGTGRAMDSSLSGGLSGIDTGIDINPNALSAITMGAWVLARSNGGDGIGKFLSHDDGSFDRTVGLDSRGARGVNYGAFTGSGVIKPNGPDPIGVWTHVVVSYDGTDVSLWRDGVLAGTTFDNTELDNSVWNLHIGTNPGFDEDFDGLIDDAFLYGRVLSEAEINDIYENGFGQVSAVPLPASLPLLMAGFAAFGWVRRRQG